MPTIGPGIPGSVMEAFAEGFACGQAGVLTVTIDDSNGANVLGPTTASIVELECTVDNFGVYRYLGVFPSDPSLSPYLITWEGASGTDPGIVTTASEEILVSTDAPSPVSGAGPCQDWIDGADVSDCCDVEYSSDTADLLEVAATQASEILFELSGRKFPGLCGPVTARPCGDSCSCWPLSGAWGGEWPDPWASWGGGFDGGSAWGWNWGGWWGWNGGSSCGCGCLSRIKLSGNVQGIAQVKIDGEVVAPSEYRVDSNRWLTHKNDGNWPACQDLSLDDDQPGTFSVSYWFGEQPPSLGVKAAEQLACEIYKSCAGEDCALPKGTTRVTRQGVTIEKLAFTSWAFTPSRNARSGRAPGWNTGLPMVDAFLNTYNPQNLIRSPIWWAPSKTKRYAPWIT